MKQEIKAACPNAEYTKIMDSKRLDFQELYKNNMEEIADLFDLGDSIKEILQKKRDFGLGKYGENSFQSTFENAMATPIAAHLGDEIIDALNYSMHGYMTSLIALDTRKAKAYEEIASKIRSIVYDLNKLKLENISDGEREALNWTNDIQGEC